MIRGQEQDEFVTVRVQDPRVQNEGSWNSYVDFKIFLHTNSKAFTAKTSCVRRRYSEFVWLKRKLQKNSGLVPVPDLPGKSFFSFSNEDFIEKRRKGLQNFLNRVLHMTVCLSDSQLHLFLQTQLPVGHIQDCVQGHTPYTVTDAILTYASSNRGWAQEEEGGAHDSCSTPVPYESMESPAPHLPSSQCERPPQAPLSETGPANELQAESTDSHNLNSVELSLSETHSSVADSPQRDGPGDNMEEGERWADLVVEVHPQHFEGHGSEDAVPDQQPIGQLETVVRPDGTEENKPEEHEQVKIQSQAVRLTSNPLQERSGLKGQDGSHLEEATYEEVKMSEAAQLGTDCGEWVSGDMNKKVDCYNEMNKEVQQEMNKKECGHKEINKKEDDQEEINEKGDDHQETVKDNCIAEATLDVVSQCEEPTPAVCNGHVSEDTNCQDNIEGTATDHQVEVLTTEKSHVGMNHDALDPDVTNVLEDEDLALAEDTPEEATQVENQTSEDTSLQDKDLVMICQAEAVLSEDHEENDPLSTIFKPDISHFQELRLNSDDADGNSEIHMQKDSEVVSNICCVSETSIAESGSMQDACSAESCLDSGLKSYSNHSVMQTVQALETDSKVTEAI